MPIYPDVEAMGRLEICHNEKWGSVCNDFAGAPTALVACRQLGYASKGLLIFIIQLSAMIISITPAHYCYVQVILNLWEISMLLFP